MQKSDYALNLMKQFKNVLNVEGLSYYLSELYSEINRACGGKVKILELGAGAGTSARYLTSQAILRTDLLVINDGSVQGSVDAENLPFPDGSFDLIFGMDFFHHIPHPTAALNEMKRVLNPNSKEIQVIMIEPYVSFFSYLPYKLFHSEETSLFKKRKLSEPVVGNEPQDGDQVIPKLYFSSKIGRNKIDRIFPAESYKIETKFISFLSFFATGGINNPLPTPTWIIKSLLYVEKKIPNQIMKYFGSRMIITINLRN